MYSSMVEHHVDIVKVNGSIPFTSTNIKNVIDIKFNDVMLLIITNALLFNN